MALLKGPNGRRFLMDEVPLQATADDLGSFGVPRQSSCAFQKANPILHEALLLFGNLPDLLFKRNLFFSTGL